MLTQLSTVKSRLALTVTDYDGILTSAIKAISDSFDKETNRTLARTVSATRRARTAVSKRTLNDPLPSFENKMPNPSPQSAPSQKCCRLPAPASPILIPQGSGVIKLGGLVVRSQCFSGGLSVNAAEALSSIFGPPITRPQSVPQCFTNLGNPFTHPPRNLRKLFRPVQNDQQRENQNYLAAAETKKREDRSNCPSDLHTSFLPLLSPACKSSRSSLNIRASSFCLVPPSQTKADHCGCPV